MNRKIEKIYKLFIRIEENYPQRGLLKNDILELKEILSSLRDEPHVDAQRFFSIHVHLHPDMSFKELVTWMVPVERYLKKDLKDEDFLIFNKDQLKTKKKTSLLPLVIILDHVRSSFNVGSIFRTCEAFNVEKIYLVGYTPDPSNSKTNKTTLGAHDHILWETVAKIGPLIENLKKQGYKIVAAETTSHAVALENPFSPMKTAIVFGNERFGLDPEVVKDCDETRIINLSGYKNSLNIANCASIFIYEFYRQWNNHGRIL